MPNREYAIYEGAVFTIEWYHSSNGKSQALEYFESLDDRQQDRFLSLVRLMGEVGKIFNTQKFNHEGEGIYAFKPQPDRFLCFFFTGKKIIVTNAFKKKMQKLPAREKVKALKARNDYETRVESGGYYG